MKGIFIMKETERNTPAAKGRQEKTKKVVIPLGIAAKSESKKTEHGYETKVGGCAATFTTPSYGKRITLGDGEKEISFSFLSKGAEQGTEEKRKPRTRFDVSEREDAHRYFYRDVALDTDLEYLTKGNGIKENIIIKERSADYRYDFSLRVKGLLPRMNETGTEIGFYGQNEKGEETLCFKIPAPFMTDAAGVRSDAVSYALRETRKGHFIFSVIADAPFVNDPARVFPVTVDPQIQVQVLNGAFPGTCAFLYGLIKKDCYVGSMYDTKEYGKDLVVMYDGTYYINVHMDGAELAPLVANKVVTRAEIVLHMKSWKVEGKEQIITDNTQTELYILNENEIKLKTLSVKGPTVRINALDLYRNAFLLSLNPVMDSQYEERHFYGEDGGEYAPRMEIEYITDEDHAPTYADIPMPSGTLASFDVRSGETFVSFADGVAATAPLGIGLSHVHNAKRSDITYGKGFALSLDETLRKDGEYSDYILTDAMGEEHGFNEYFYYETNGTAIYVDAEEVTANDDGELTYTKDYVTYPVTRTFRSSTGWELITKLDGVKNKELHDRYTEEEKKVKQYKEALGEYVSVSVGTGEIGEKLADPSFSDYNEHAPNETYMFLPYTDAMSYRSLCLQREALNAQLAAYSLEQSALNLQRDSIALQILSNGTQKNNYFHQYNLQQNEYSLIGQQIAYSNRAISIYCDSNTLFTNLNAATTEKQAQYCNLYLEKSLLEQKRSRVADIMTDLYNGPNNFYSLAQQQESLLNRQKNLVGAETDGANNQVKQLNTEKSVLSEQRALCEQQISEFKNRASRYYETFQELLISYLKAVEQMPVSYLQKDGIVKGFNEAGKLTAIFDAYGNAVLIDRDEKDRVEKICDESGNGMTLFYENGKLSSLTDLRGDRVRYTYDGNALVTVTYSDGASLHFTYDTSGNLCAVCSDGDSSDKMRSDLTYDSYSRLIRAVKLPETYALNHNVYWEMVGDPISLFDVEYGVRTVVTDGLRLTTAVYGFDDHENLSEYYEIANGLVSRAEKTERGYMNGNRYTTVYTALAPLLGEKELSAFSFGDVSVQKTHTVYDSLRRPVSSFAEAVFPTLGTGEYAEMHEYAYSETTCTYGTSGKLATQTTVKGNGYYDPATGTKTKQSPYATHITEYGYDMRHRLMRRESYTDEKQYIEGKTVEEWVYDEKGNLIKSFTYNSLDPSSKFYTESILDEKGRTVAEYDATGKYKTTYAYDAFGTLVSESYPNGATFAYGSAPDGRARAITQSTAEGESCENTLLYTAGEMTRVVSGDNAVGYRYNSQRRLIEIDVNDRFHIGWVRTERVNEAGEKEYTTEIPHGNGDMLRIVSDIRGNVKRKERGKDTDESLELVYTAEYAADGRPLLVRGAYGDTIQRFVYDEKKRLVSYLDGAEQYGYDTNDRLVSRTVTAGGETQSYTYTYDAVTGRLTKTVADGLEITPKYDLLGRSAGKTVKCSTTVTLDERQDYLKVGDHATVLPSSLVYTKNKVTQGKLAYLYDEMGNIREIKENGTIVARYAYDGFDRLVREDNKPMGKTTVFSYDTSGNILSKREYAFTLKQADELAEADCIERIYTYEGDRLMSYDGETCSYDEIGNPATYRGNQCIWCEGGILQFYKSSWVGSDALGKMMSIGDYETGLYNAVRYDEAGRIIRHAKDDGHPSMRFTYDHTGVLGCKVGDSYYLYRKDVQGNIIAILDRNGNVVVKYVYDAWGNHKVLDKDGNEITDATHIGHRNPFRYRGYYYDTIIGFYYLKSRFYDPETGRFLSPDSVEYLDPETIGGLNLYAYCNNNPVMFSDPEGHMPKLWQWIVAGVAIAGAITISVLTLGTATPVVAGMLIGGAVSAGFEIGSQIIFDGGIHDGGAILSSALGGMVSGAIGAINIGGWLGAFVIGGVGSSIGGVVSGSVTDFQSFTNAFEIGAFSGLIAYGISYKILDAKTNKIFNQSRKSKSLSVQKLQSHPLNMGAEALKGKFRNSFKEITRKEIADLITRSDSWIRWGVYSSLVASSLSGWY